MAVGLGVVLLSLAIYTVSNHDRRNFYNHFVWQASAWLEGQAAIRYPVVGQDGSPGNDYFQDVLPVEGADGTPTGRGLIPFPPLPAVLLVPFVALWGLTTNAQLIATVVGAIDVGLAFWMLGRLPVRPAVRVACTVFLGFGTVFWYAAELGSTWYFAHVVAVGLTLLAIGIALDADTAASRSDAGASRSDAGASRSDDGTEATGGRTAGVLDGRQFAAGFLLGLAATSRLTLLLGAPFLVLVGGGGTWLRRSVSAGLGASLPVLALLAYNVASTGHIFHPGYDYLYHLEAGFYTFLDYKPDWGIEDPRYLPQNFAIMFLRPPDILPACDPPAARGIFDAACPFVVPNPIGMSLLLTSPGWLLALPSVRWLRRDRIVAGAVIAVVLIAAVNLMHFSQGWVQFGYRFSSDFAPFAIVLVALVMERWRALWRPGLALIGLSIAVNAWGVAWGNILGW
ncbi:MAG TPA: hypothetical protein VIV06_05100 [Candidatus Limnocylindrales bacterium]